VEPGTVTGPDQLPSLAICDKLFSMQASRPFPSPRPYGSQKSLARNLSWFMVVPVTVAVLCSMAAVLLLTTYQVRHDNRIFTGVYLWGIDLSGMTREEARRALTAAFPYAQEEAIVLVDPHNGQEWARTPRQLGLYLDVEGALHAAYAVGRSSGPLADLEEQFDTWYYGRVLAPVIIFDESRLDAALAELAAEINRPPRDAALHYDGSSVDFIGGQVGRSLDVADLRGRLASPLADMRPARIEMLIHETAPRIEDTSAVATAIQQIIGNPISFYLQEPLAGVDLDRVTLSSEELTRWLRIQMVEDGDGRAHYEAFVDENAVRFWLAQFEDQLYRPPVNARFYFDDPTQQLVLVEPHVNGRALDVEATLARFREQVTSANRSLPFVLQDIVPVAHSGATAEELGIVELISESTTWFFGSSIERKHNIARSANQFYGIVIAPGEVFSFNHYLGEISEEAGYQTGLIIWGGRTIEGVGGGVCQVSTTVFQTAFWAGFPIEERWPHGYRVRYYDDGEGAGMDAAIFSPLIDLRFINDTPHHLLIENYFNERHQSLTFKFYSTSTGRTVVKEGPEVANVIPPKPDVWEFNSDLAAGKIEQVDWAVEGSDVTVWRTVINRDGLVLENKRAFFSRYIPWQNVFQYGPGVQPPSRTPTPEPTPDPGENGEES
jgi:vancomycin resistance protein YoaR